MKNGMAIDFALLSTSLKLQIFEISKLSTFIDFQQRICCADDKKLPFSAYFRRCANEHENLLF